MRGLDNDPPYPPYPLRRHSLCASTEEGAEGYTPLKRSPPGLLFRHLVKNSGGGCYSGGRVLFFWILADFSDFVFGFLRILVDSLDSRAREQGRGKKGQDTGLHRIPVWPPPIRPPHFCLDLGP